ncbi:hypothetical protein RKD48_005049 [Streptomyces ambofaciens]
MTTAVQVPFAALSAPLTWSTPFGAYFWSRPLVSACWMKGGRVTRTSACGLRFSRTVRCTISPEPPSTYSTLMPVSFSKSLKTRSYQPSPFSPLRPSAL